MSTPQRQAALYKEGRLDLALQAYLQGKFQTPTTAAIVYNVLQTMLQCRIAGIQPQLGSILRHHLLTPTEEESLVQ